MSLGVDEVGCESPCVGVGASEVAVLAGGEVAVKARGQLPVASGKFFKILVVIYKVC